MYMSLGVCSMSHMSHNALHSSSIYVDVHVYTVHYKTYITSLETFLHKHTTWWNNYDNHDQQYTILDYGCYFSPSSGGVGSESAAGRASAALCRGNCSQGEESSNLRYS